ncbi:MAG TPA: 6-phosphofructokinase [Candidatus Cloacimonadota bacterium]|nr:6-phosphofructokinase [Candidatus Cloacimonadota bacterium]
MNLQGKVVIAQGGGPTAVINQSLVGAILESKKFSQITKIYGAVGGIRGIINEDFLDLSQETTHNLEQVAISASSALLSTRDKPDDDYCTEAFHVMKAHDVRYFFYIGGNDSSDTVRIINEKAIQENYDFRAIHIPKTIDNDLVLNDHTPGFGSAARFVAEAFIGANLDNRSLPGVYIGIVMGRHAGFLTAASAMAKKFPDDGPHLIYLPERVFDKEQFLQDVKNTYDKYGRCVIAVSEGITDKNGTPIISTLSETVEKDAHGNVQLSGTGALGDLLSDYIKKNLKISRVRSDTFGYLQRSFMPCVSDIDQIEAREVGEKAAHFAIWHNINCSITIQRVGNYAVEYKPVPLKEIAAKTRLMPDEYINSNGNYITNDFISYCAPLIGSDFAQPARIRAPKVDRIVKK